jgi:tetratricopeptide (TPR) repeat protein
MYALLATPLVFQAIRRAYIQGVVSRPVTFEEVRRVCGLDPENAECALRSAVMAEQYGATSVELWLKAVGLNQLDSSVMIQAALAHESMGEVGQAERFYLDAARLSRTWLPRWSLANYYYRRGSQGEVAKWARLALERGYGDRVPLYSLCLSSGLTHVEILDSVLPAGHVPSIETYMAFLRSRPVSEDTLAALTASSLRLEKSATSKPLPRPSVDQLALAADFLIRAGQPERAYRIWEGMLRLLPAASVGATGGLSDAGFSAAPLAAPAFGWEMARDEGVEIVSGTPPGGVKIELSGRQPETLMALSQCIRLNGARRWRLGFETSGAGDQPVGRHFRWVVSKLGSGEEIVAATLDGLGEDQWLQSGVTWQSPKEDGFYRLGLVYSRPLGSARLTGELRIRALRLDSEAIRP